MLTQKRSGFTLIELLVAIGIIAVIAAMAVNSYLDSRVRARDTAIKTGARSYSDAMELYFAKNRTYAVYYRGTGGGVCALGVNSAIPPANPDLKYRLKGDGAACVGYKGSGEGQMTRRTSGVLPNYKSHSIADVLLEQGFINQIQTFPGVKGYETNGFVEEELNGTAPLEKIPKDFILTLCDKDGKEALSESSAVNYAVYGHVQRKSDKEVQDAKNLCGAYPYGWNVLEAGDYSS